MRAFPLPALPRARGRERRRRLGLPISQVRKLVSRGPKRKRTRGFGGMTKSVSKTKSAAAKKPAPKKGSYASRRWQSDIIVDLIKQFGFPYIALNPGATSRGLHDSLVNYGGKHTPTLRGQ